MKEVLEIKSPYQGLNGKQQSATEKSSRYFAFLL